MAKDITGIVANDEPISEEHTGISENDGIGSVLPYDPED